MSYDFSKEALYRDDACRVVKAEYDGEVISDHRYYCTNCGLQETVNYFDFDPNKCSRCEEPRVPGGFSEYISDTAMWVDVRPDG